MGQVGRIELAVIELWLSAYAVAGISCAEGLADIRTGRGAAFDSVHCAAIAGELQVKGDVVICTVVFERQVIHRLPHGIEDIVLIVGGINADDRVGGKIGNKIVGRFAPANQLIALRVEEVIVIFAEADLKVIRLIGKDHLIVVEVGINRVRINAQTVADRIAGVARIGVKRQRGGLYDTHGFRFRLISRFKVNVSLSVGIGGIYGKGVARCVILARFFAVIGQQLPAAENIVRGNVGGVLQNNCLCVVVIIGSAG